MSDTTYAIIDIIKGFVHFSANSVVIMTKANTATNNEDTIDNIILVVESILLVVESILLVVESILNESSF